MQLHVRITDGVIRVGYSMCLMRSSVFSCCHKSTVMNTVHQANRQQGNYDDIMQAYLAWWYWRWTDQEALISGVVDIFVNLNVRSKEGIVTKKNSLVLVDNFTLAHFACYIIYNHYTNVIVGKSWTVRNGLKVTTTNVQKIFTFFWLWILRQPPYASSSS